MPVYGAPKWQKESAWHSGLSGQLDPVGDFMLPADAEPDIFPLGVLSKLPVNRPDQIRMVVDFTEMGESNSPEIAVKEGFQKLTGLVVGQMAMAASDTLLQVRRIGAVEQ